MKIKKIAALVLALVMVLGLAACGGGGGSSLKGTTIKVAASPTPHADILAIAKEVLAEKDITLEIIEYNDYVQPCEVTESGEVDANYFAHLPYIENFNAENGTHMVNVAGIHYEPFGVYPGKVATLEELPDGAKIAVPNDGSNEARALILLQELGLITLKEGSGFNATKLDIVDNPKNLDIVEMEAAQLPRVLQDVDMAVINGNYALEAGLSVVTDAVASEDAASNSAQTYTNILVVKEGNENSEAVKALIEALQSQKVKDYINETYNGAVVAMF